MQYLWTWLTKNKLLKAIEDLIQEAITTTPQSQEAIKRLDKQSLVVVIEPPGLALMLSIEGTQIRIARQDGEDEGSTETSHTSTHLRITGSPLSLARLALAEDKQSIIESEPLRIEGATSSLYAWQKLFKSLNIEWEMQLAARIGAIPAKLIITPLRVLREQAQATMNNLSGNIEHAMVWNDYAVAEYELKELSNKSHDLRAKVDQLNARVNRFT